MFVRLTGTAAHWPLWRERRPVLATFLVVYIAAIAAAVPLSPIAPDQMIHFLVLVALGGVTTMLCWRMERARKFLEASNVPNLAATWTFAGVLLLGPSLAVAAAVAIYGFQWGAQKKLYVGKTHRYLYNAAMVMVAVRVAQLVHNPLLSGLTLVGVNMALVAGFLAVSGRAVAIKRMASLAGQSTEALTFVLGWATALLLEAHLVFGPAVVPVVIGVQYVLLVWASRQPSTIDTDTGVLTARAWNALAGLRLSQVREAIVMHVAVAETGGRSWAECAAAVRASLRPEDLIGRTADGFVALVAGAGDMALADLLALQMRARLAVSRIETYIGLAVTPDGGDPVDLQGLSVAAGADAIIRAVDIHA